MASIIVSPRVALYSEAGAASATLDWARLRNVCEAAAMPNCTLFCALWAYRGERRMHACVSHSCQACQCVLESSETLSVCESVELSSELSKWSVLAAVLALVAMGQRND